MRDVADWHMIGGAGGRESARRVLTLVALLGPLGLLVAGCGGGSGAPSVARVGSTATSTSSAAGAATLTPQQEVAIDVAYAACLSKHGVEVQAMRTGGLVWDTGPGVARPAVGAGRPRRA